MIVDGSIQRLLLRLWKSIGLPSLRLSIIWVLVVKVSFSLRHIEQGWWVGLVSSAELCPTAEDPDKVIKDMKKWLTQEGLADLDAVSLFAEKLEQVGHWRPDIEMSLRVRKPFKGSRRSPISSTRKRPTILSSELLLMVSLDRLYSSLPTLSIDWTVKSSDSEIELSWLRILLRVVFHLEWRVLWSVSRPRISILFGIGHSWVERLWEEGVQSTEDPSLLSLHAWIWLDLNSPSTHLPPQVKDKESAKVNSILNSVLDQMSLLSITNLPYHPIDRFLPSLETPMPNPILKLLGIYHTVMPLVVYDLNMRLRPLLRLTRTSCKPLYLDIKPRLSMLLVDLDTFRQSRLLRLYLVYLMLGMVMLMDMDMVRRVGDEDVVLLGEPGLGAGDEVELLCLSRMVSK
jgi:hypothetical protein